MSDNSTTVNFNLRTAGFVNYANQTLTFRLLTAGATGSNDFVVLPSVVTATSDANGDGSVVLFRNGVSDIESVHEVIFPNREKAQFIIPSGTATVELSNLLVNSQPSGSNTQQSSVYAQAIQRANHTGTQLLSTISDAATVQLKPSEGAFANGDKTKLDGIEASADVTDTTNVTAAGALMDSELTSIANVKALNQSVVSGASPVFSTTNMTDATDKRLMTDAQESKLDGIEALADVTDTTNVTSAGALMDSELADLTGVKTLLLPDSTTITDFAKTFLDDADAAAVKTTLGITAETAQVNFVPRSISFTNTSAFLSLADAPALDVGTSDFTLAFFARLDSSGTEPVLTKLSGTGYRLRFVSGALILTMQDSGGSADFSLATGLNDNKWHTYVVTVDRSGNAIAYVDNVAQTGVDVSGTALTLDNSGQFQIGSDGGSNAGDGIALGNYVILIVNLLDASEAARIYFSPDSAPLVEDCALMVDLRKADKTFTDVGTNGFAVTTNGTIIFNEGRITSLDGATIGATTAAAITGTTITASTKFAGAIDGTVGATTPAAVTGTNVLASAQSGYNTGGTITQLTSITTDVSLDQPSGVITLFANNFGANSTTSFTLNNNFIDINDVVVASFKTGHSELTLTVTETADDSCTFTLYNPTGSSTGSITAVINFAIIKTSTT